MYWICRMSVSLISLSNVGQCGQLWGMVGSWHHITLQGSDSHRRVGMQSEVRTCSKGVWSWSHTTSITTFLSRPGGSEPWTMVARRQFSGLDLSPGLKRWNIQQEGQPLCLQRIVADSWGSVGRTSGAEIACAVLQNLPSCHILSPN